MVASGAWNAHLESRQHCERLSYLSKKEGELPTVKNNRIPLTKKHNLSVEPKKYTGENADVETYVTHAISDELNEKASCLLSKLIEWQARTKEMDPMNAKRKKRLLCGLREAAKAIKLGRACGLIVAPNIQPLNSSDPDIDDHCKRLYEYPVDGILRDCQEHGVPVVFALSRRKMGRLLGQKKSVSIFALLNIQGAENEFKDLLSIAK